MCQIIVQKPGAPLLDDAILQAEWNANPHGGGIMAASDGQLFVEKFSKLKNMIREYKAYHAEAGAKSCIALHFRWATHGAKTQDNIHPFWANNHVAMMHNGILRGLGDKEFSDSAYFARYALGWRTTEELMSPGFLTWLDEVADWNRIVLMDNTGAVSVANAEMGSLDAHGNWYSAIRAREMSANMAEWRKQPRGNWWDEEDDETAELVEGLSFGADVDDEDTANADFEREFLRTGMLRGNQ